MKRVLPPIAAAVLAGMPAGAYATPSIALTSGTTP
jgi:hypothetical protein